MCTGTVCKGTMCTGTGVLRILICTHVYTVCVLIHVYMIMYYVYNGAYVRIYVFTNCTYTFMYMSK